MLVRPGRCGRRQCALSRSKQHQLAPRPFPLPLNPGHQSTWVVHGSSLGRRPWSMVERLAGDWPWQGLISAAQVAGWG